MRTHFIREIGKMEDTHWWHKRKREIISDVIQRYLLKSSKNRKQRVRILEIGAGTSLLIKEFNDRADTYALDRNKTALNLSKKNGIGNTILADLGTYTGYKRNYFDIVVAADVLEHVEDDRGAVAKVHAMLKKGGIFIVHVPADQKLFSYWDTQLGHFRRYSKREISSLLRQNKFTITYLSYRLPTIYPFVRIFRKISNKSKKKKSDFQQFSIFNTPLYFYTKIEDQLIIHKFLKPSFGLSLFAVAKK